jgi:hypothetical protein
MPAHALQWLGVPLALVYGGAMEWLIHKHLLHGVGANKKSVFSFHWHEHHRESRRQKMFDPQYERPLFTWSPQGKEALSIALLVVLHAPLVFWFPAFGLTVWLGALGYYFVHRHAHMNPEWCKRWLRVHYDHHMGIDQNANWCVLHPWFDVLMGTRKHYRYDAAGRAHALPVPEVAGPEGQADLEG